MIAPRRAVDHEYGSRPAGNFNVVDAEWTTKQERARVTRAGDWAIGRRPGTMPAATEELDTSSHNIRTTRLRLVLLWRLAL